MGSIFATRLKPKLSLEERVIRSAEGALEDQKQVSAIDVLCRMGLLAPSNVDSWRQGRIGFLEEMIQGSPEKVGRALELFREWAESKGLKPVEARYVRSTREGEQELRFTNVKYPELEQALRLHYVSPHLSERRREAVEKKAASAPERVVFMPRKEAVCSECGVPVDDFLSMEAGQPLCMACAGLGELEFLPRGDTALTRRATKYSSTRAVAVEWSRSRKRYERQGILVEEAAIRRAEEECAADAEQRARNRELAAVARTKEDAAFVERLEQKIRSIFPRCPAAEVRRIAEHTALRGSGRVGRSSAGRKLDENAVTLAVVASVRHRHTNYDELLARGADRETARLLLRDQIEAILDSWR